MSALDLVIADGEVHVFAGIYFHVSGDSTKISGYFRAGGSLNILGLITAYVEFDVSLAYENGNVSGECTVTIGIEIGFFEIDVNLTCRKEFSGSGANKSASLNGPKNSSGVTRLLDPVIYADDSPVSTGPCHNMIEKFMDQRQWKDYWKAFA